MTSLPKIISTLTSYLLLDTVVPRYKTNVEGNVFWSRIVKSLAFCPRFI